MRVKELIEQLKTVDQNANVFTGYDGNVVVSEPATIAEIKSEADIANCWWKVKTGDVVVLCAR